MWRPFRWVCNHIATWGPFHCQSSIQNSRQSYVNYSLSIKECIVLISVVVLGKWTEPKTLKESLHFKGLILPSIQRPDPRHFEGLLFLSKSPVATHLFWDSIPSSSLHFGGQYIPFIIDMEQNAPIYFTPQVETYLQPNRQVDNLWDRNSIPEKQRATPNSSFLRWMPQRKALSKSSCR